MTEQDRKRALELVVHIGRYADHMHSCTYRNSPDSDPASDYCSCGYSSAAASYRELVTILQKG